MTQDPTAETARFSDEAWVDVLRSVDQTYAELVRYQNQLESRNSELEGMRSFLVSVLAAMNDVLIVCGHEGQVLEVNSAFIELAGKPREQVLGTQFTDWFAESERETMRRGLQVLARERAVQNAERLFLTPSEPTPLEMSATARRDSRGRYVGAVLIGRPVGELRRALVEMERSHSALKEAQAQLVHSEKLASLGRLLAGVAHELNNPISFVYGNTHALDRYTTRFETYFDRVEAGADRAELMALRQELKLDRVVRNMRSAVQGALEGSERVRDIVESLRRLSAEGSGEPERFDLLSLAQTAAHWVIKGRASNVAVRFDAPAPVFAFGRMGHIQQVIMNLLQNALDAMDGQKDGAIDVCIAASDGEAVLEVADRGPGIPSDIALRIFDPFFTTKPVGQGTGLGLAISYKIATENGGTLSACNREDGGAVFRLCLPVGNGQRDNDKADTLEVGAAPSRAAPSAMEHDDPGAQDA